MKKIIDRTLFWFRDGSNQLQDLDKKYFAMGNLLNRLLCDSYQGKKIQFINIYFRTEQTYELNPNASKNHAHFYGGHLNYNAVLDLSSFNKLGETEQDEFVWKRAYEILKEASITIKNKELLKACEYAYKKGMEIGLNPDYKMVEKNIELFDQVLKASVWVNFKKDGMRSKFTLEKDNKIVFEKEIDRTENGIEFFLEMYKDIDLEDNNVIIKGRRDVEYLPLKIPIKKEKLSESIFL